MTTYQKSSLQEIVGSLQKGQKWLTEQWRALMAGKEYTEKEQLIFDAGMTRWEQFDRLFQTTKPTICIWGANKHCPKTAPIVCFVCEEPAPEV